jgi:hypothetical protein
VYKNKLEIRISRGFEKRKQSKGENNSQNGQGQGRNWF